MPDRRRSPITAGQQLGEVRRLSIDAERQVLSVVGVEAETRLPWAGLHQLLRPLLPGISGLPGPQRGALSTALGMTAASGAPPDPYLIALAVLSLLSDAAAMRPLTVLADDVQWLDMQSQEAGGGERGALNHLAGSTC
jgi:hypothetical protein